LGKTLLLADEGIATSQYHFPYLLEPVRLLEKGVAPEQIDQAALDFGMPMGPIELAGSVGLYICLSVAERLADFLHTSVPEILRAAVIDGNLGRKSGRGFYVYNGKGPVQAHRLRSSTGSGAIAERMILQLLNESIACLREAVVVVADLLDAGVVYGTRFAPFRGGPIHYIRDSGWDRIRDRLRQMEQQHGKQFSADRGWEAFA